MNTSILGKKRARQAARELLQQFGDTLPIGVEGIAAGLAVDVLHVEFEDHVSGMLVVKNDQATIGVNAKHHPNRQRFTIAHELGHYLLHRDDEQVFVDAAVFFRSEGATDVRWNQEKEANIFAAELLLPERAIREDWINDPIDVFDDDAIKRWSKRFRVSSQALLIRLTELDLAFPPMA